MSAKSRQREYDRRYRGGFPTYAAFQAWQADELARRFPETPESRAQRAADEARFDAGIPLESIPLLCPEPPEACE